MLNLASLWKPKVCGQKELPDRSVLIGQKLVENAKIKKFKCDTLGDFQTLCTVLKTPFILSNIYYVRLGLKFLLDKNVYKKELWN